MATMTITKTASIASGCALAAGLFVVAPAAASGEAPGPASVAATKIGGKSCNKITGPSAPNAHGAKATGGPFQIGRDYLRTFYPRWFTYYQAEISPCNQLLGPRRVTPTYRAVVAINVDTIYTSSTVDVSQQPVIVTVPEADTIFSVLQRRVRHCAVRDPEQHSRHVRHHRAIVDGHASDRRDRGQDAL